MATLNGAEVQRARVYLPIYGIWSARVALVASRALAPGAAVSLAIGDLSLAGTIRRGDDFVGESSYFLVGGADGWRLPVPPRPKPYRADNGVRTVDVLTDLAADAGERVVVETGVPPFVGAAWSRDRQSGAVLLADVCRQVGARAWMTPDGVTHVGVSRPPAELPAGLAFTADLDPGRGRALVASPEDKIAAFLPGAILRAPGIAGLAIRSTEVHLEPGAISLVVSARDPAEIFASGLATATPQGRWTGAYVYSVREQVGARLSVRAVDQAAGLPDELLIDKAHGIAGSSELCVPGQSVIVYFRGGSPAAPYVAAYLPSASLPTSTRIDAQTTVTLGAEGSDPLAKGPATDSALTALRTGVNAALSALSLPSVPSLGSVNASKARGE